MYKEHEMMKKYIAGLHPRYWPGLAFALCLIAFAAFALIPLLHGLMAMTGTDYVLSAQYNKHPALEIISHIAAIALVILTVTFKFVTESTKNSRGFVAASLLIIGCSSLVGIAVRYL